jgi:hypothetical protein
MRSTPRALALLLAASAATAQAQAPPQQQRAPQTSKPKPKSERAAAVDPVAEARRTTAVLLVNSLADEARSFRDEQLRARVQARAAEALWEIDAERARSLFRRAWDAAELADREHARRTEEERQRQMAARGSFAMQRPPNIRGEVLRLAGRRDRALAEEFLARIEGARKEEAATPVVTPDAAEPSRPASALPASSSQYQRMELARQLVRAGEVERAVQIAEPGLQAPTHDALLFITDLREASPERADRIYATLLARAASDPAADANTVSTLASYVLTPRLFITIEGGGYNIDSGGPSRPPAEFPAELRAAFLQTAAQILLRPPAPADQDRGTSGRSATYFMITRLLPFFEQHTPALLPQLRTQLASLTPDVSDDFRNEVGKMAGTGLERRDQQPEPDEVQAALDRLSRATTPEQRDRAYVSAAMAAAGRNDPRAREFAEKVSDRDARAQLLAFIDYSAAARAVEKKDVEELLRVARRGDLAPLQRVWALTEAARLTAKADRAATFELLDEAFAAARRIDGDDADRARAMLSVFTPLYELDAARVWSLLPELVKTVNALPDFTGEDGRIVAKFQTKGHSSIRSSTVEGFNLQPLFRALAKADLDRAVEFAKSFTGEAPRAVATLAVATAVLGEADNKPRPRS